MSPDSPSRRPPMPFELTADAALALGRELPDTGFLFEIAWEVCNQVGGIYQVIRSKAPLMTSRWKDQYCLIGPYDANKAQLEVELTPPKGWLAALVDLLAQSGLVVHHGRWLIQGKPHVLLLEMGTVAGSLAQTKFRLWKDHGLESPAVDPVIDM